MFCPNCGAKVIEGAAFCIECGTPLSVNKDMPKVTEASTKPQGNSEGTKDNTPDSFAANKTSNQNLQSQNLDKEASAEASNHHNGYSTLDYDAPCEVQNSENISEPKDAEYATLSDVIGKNSNYYLSEFQKIDSGEKTKYNWAAFFLGAYFCLYRKCATLCKKYFLGPYILIVVGSIITSIGTMVLSFTAMMAGGVATAVGYAWNFVNNIRLGKNFNTAYYWQCKDVLSTGDKKKYGTSMQLPCMLIIALIAIAIITSIIPTVGSVDGGLGEDYGDSNSNNSIALQPQVTATLRFDPTEYAELGVGEINDDYYWGPKDYFNNKYIGKKFFIFGKVIEVGEKYAIIAYAETDEQNPLIYFLKCEFLHAEDLKRINCDDRIFVCGQIGEDDYAPCLEGCFIPTQEELNAVILNLDKYEAFHLFPDLPVIPIYHNSEFLFTEPSSPYFLPAYEYIEIEELYDTYVDNQIRYTATYGGQYIKTSGYITDMWYSSSIDEYIMKIATDVEHYSAPTLTCYFDNSCGDLLSTLHKYDIITVCGRLSENPASYLTLENADICWY